MKFRTSFLKDSIINTSLFSEYITEETSAYVILELEEKDASDFYRIFQGSVAEEAETYFLMNNIDCVGEDGYIYLLSADGIEKQNQKSDFTLKKVKKHKKKMHKLKTKVYSETDRLLSMKKETSSLKKPSLSKFKPYTFVSKENNITFPYRLKKSKEENQPLVIYFHGGGCVGIDNFKPLYEFITPYFSGKLNRYDCSVLIPQTPLNMPCGKANSIDYLHSVKQLSEIIADEVRADKNRIYIFGGSFGGFCTWFSAYSYPDYYACAIPVMGTFEEILFEETDYSRLKNMPLWVAHSSDDTVVPIEMDDKITAQLKEISKNIKYTRWDKYGHKMAVRFYRREDWVKWMFEQSLDKR